MEKTMSEEKDLGGRPTKYEDRFCQLMIDYFNKETYKVVLLENKKGIEEPHEIPSPLPTFEGFATSIGICKKTLLNWTVEHKEFLHAYELCKDYQKEILIQNGLMGNYNCLFAKFVAINATDMKEKQEIEHSGDINIKVDIKDDES